MTWSSYIGNWFWLFISHHQTENMRFKNYKEFLVIVYDYVFCIVFDL
jgi:hypothetical protein